MTIMATITATPATVAAGARRRAAAGATREGHLRRAKLAESEGNPALAAKLRKLAAAY